MATKYDVLEVVGAGGMATVHRARAHLGGLEGLKRIVAIKRIRPQLASAPDHVARLVREARVLALLAHPNIIEIYELGRSSQGPFIAMELLEGWSLSRIAGAASALEITIPLSVTLSLLHDLCDALDHVHTCRDPAGSPLGIVHRDVSPGNLFVTRSGHLKLIDFGIAALGRETPDTRGQIAGNPPYMAPEAISGGPIDAHADIFAVGVVAWELITGRVLFARSSHDTTLAAVRAAKVPRPSELRPDCPRLLEDLVLSALIKDSCQRTVTAADLCAGIAVVARSCEIDAHPSAVARWLTDSGLSAALTCDERSFARDTASLQVLALEPGPVTPELAPFEPVVTRRPTPMAWQSAAAPAAASSRSRAVVRTAVAAMFVAGCLVGYATVTPHERQLAQPAYLTVHIDTLAPEHRAEFEAARREWVAVLHRAHATDQRGTFYEVADVGFVTMRPFATFADLDARAADRKRALAAVPAEALQRYDARSDAALGFPHYSEIWQRDDDLGYAPRAGALDEQAANAIEMIVEDVKADSASEREYDATWREIRAALEAAQYPLTRITYETVYGSGRVVTLWLAPSSAALTATSVEAALCAQLGDVRAAALLARRDAIVLHREQHRVSRRDDLSVP
jgi:serine/threonine protein kinase